MLKFFLALLLFFIVANPATFKLTRKVLGAIASPDGLPTQLGVAVHALVYVLLTGFVMRRFSRYEEESKYADESAYAEEYEEESKYAEEYEEESKYAEESSYANEEYTLMPGAY